MFDVDNNFLSPLDLKKDKITQDFQVDPPISVIPLTEPFVLQSFHSAKSSL